MNLAERDLKHIWHPCSQMKDYESFPPLEVAGADGCHLFLRNGGRLIDAVSSWWCKSLGHGHPRLRQALLRQAEKFEHVILANTTNETIVELSEALASLSPSLGRVFYASEGSTAVEIAVKMSLHAQRLSGRPGRNRFLALENGYHGESAAALALSDLGLYRRAYEDLLPPVETLRGLPYLDGPSHPLWNDCGSSWEVLKNHLERVEDALCAVVVEPVLQGAGGMLLYSPDLLRRLRGWTRGRGIHLIADEILTGLGRTGRALAVEHAGVAPDFLCLSKALTAGWLPMSAVLTSDDIYDLFYADYAEGRSFLHSNTYAGNALAAAVALEAWRVYREEDLFARAASLESELRQRWESVARATGRLENIRALGAVAAADIRGGGTRMGYRVYKEAVARGALLRPLGNTLYWLPPLNVPLEVLDELADITERALAAVERP